MAEAKRWLRGLTAADITRLNPGQSISSAFGASLRTPLLLGQFHPGRRPGKCVAGRPVLATTESVPTPEFYLFGLVGGIMALVFVAGVVRAHFV